MGVCSSAVRVLDGALGPRLCGITISGNVPPRPKDLKSGESLSTLTRRALIDPMMDLMGYGAPQYDLDGVRNCDGTILASVPMNRPLQDPKEQAMMFMRSHGSKRGLATNGFQWILLEPVASGMALCTVDLRPYYIEALERSRFRTAILADPAVAGHFLEVFGRR